MAPGQGLRPGPAPLANDESAHRVFLDWERLRVAYNAATVGSLFAFGAQLDQLSEPWFPRFFVIFALLTNVAFCVGPCAEGYLSWLGMDRRGARMLLFVLGTLAACFWCFVLLSERNLHPEAPNLARQRTPHRRIAFGLIEPVSAGGAAALDR